MIFPNKVIENPLKMILFPKKILFILIDMLWKSKINQAYKKVMFLQDK